MFGTKTRLGLLQCFETTEYGVFYRAEGDIPVLIAAGHQQQIEAAKGSRPTILWADLVRRPGLASP